MTQHFNFLKLQHNLPNHLKDFKDSDNIWDEAIFPLIHKHIWQTLYCSTEKILEGSSNCTSFELLGYDVILDQNLYPWILEVNMSPAMAHRNEDQSLLINKMCTGLFNISILPFLLKNYAETVISEDESFGFLQPTYYNELPRFHMCSNDCQKPCIYLKSDWKLLSNYNIENCTANNEFEFINETHTPIAPEVMIKNEDSNSKSFLKLENPWVDLNQITSNNNTPVAPSSSFSLIVTGNSIKINTIEKFDHIISNFTNLLKLQKWIKIVVKKIKVKNILLNNSINIIKNNLIINKNKILIKKFLILNHKKIKLVKFLFNVIYKKIKRNDIISMIKKYIYSKKLTLIKYYIKNYFINSYFIRIKKNKIKLLILLSIDYYIKKNELKFMQLNDINIKPSHLNLIETENIENIQNIENINNPLENQELLPNLEVNLEQSLDQSYQDDFNLEIESNTLSNDSILVHNLELQNDEEKTHEIFNNNYSIIQDNNDEIQKNTVSVGCNEISIQNYEDVQKDNNYNCDNELQENDDNSEINNTQNIEENTQPNISSLDFHEIVQDNGKDDLNNVQFNYNPTFNNLNEKMDIISPNSNNNNKKEIDYEVFNEEKFLSQLNNSNEIPNCTLPEEKIVDKTIKDLNIEIGKRNKVNIVGNVTEKSINKSKLKNSRLIPEVKSKNITSSSSNNEKVSVINEPLVDTPMVDSNLINYDEFIQNISKNKLDESFEDMNFVDPINFVKNSSKKIKIKVTNKLITNSSNNNQIDPNNNNKLINKPNDLVINENHINILVDKLCENFTLKKNIHDETYHKEESNLLEDIPTVKNQIDLKPDEKKITNHLKQSKSSKSSRNLEFNLQNNNDESLNLISESKESKIEDFALNATNNFISKSKLQHQNIDDTNLIAKNNLFSVDDNFCYTKPVYNYSPYNNNIEVEDDEYSNYTYPHPSPPKTGLPNFSRPFRMPNTFIASEAISSKLNDIKRVYSPAKKRPVLKSYEFSNPLNMNTGKVLLTEDALNHLFSSNIDDYNININCNNNVNTKKVVKNNNNNNKIKKNVSNKTSKKKSH